MKQEYTPAETAAFKAKRNAATRDFRKAMRERGTLVQPQYPETATAHQRGAIAPGGAVLHFDGLRKLEPQPRESRGLKNSNRKPTGGSKYILQKIKKNAKGELLTATVNVCAKHDKSGKVITPAFSYKKAKPKCLRHERPARQVKPLFDKAAA